MNLISPSNHLMDCCGHENLNVELILQQSSNIYFRGLYVAKPFQEQIEQFTCD